MAHVCEHAHTVLLGRSRCYRSSPSFARMQRSAVPRGMRCDPRQLVAEAMRVWREAHVAPDPVVRALRSTQVQIAAGFGDGHEHGLVCGHQVCRSGRQGSSSGRSAAQGLATHAEGMRSIDKAAASCAGLMQWP